MRITAAFIMNLKTKEVTDKVNKAAKKAIKDVITDIAGDAIKGSPVLTGNNRRSIMFEVGPGGQVAKGELEGAVYSTSGYGGWLEIGHGSVAPRPYFKPALDMNIHKLPQGIKAELT